MRLTKPAIGLAAAGALSLGAATSAAALNGWTGFAPHATGTVSSTADQDRDRDRIQDPSPTATQDRTRDRDRDCLDPTASPTSTAAATASQDRLREQVRVQARDQQRDGTGAAVKAMTQQQSRNAAQERSGQ